MTPRKLETAAARIHRPAIAETMIAAAIASDEPLTLQILDAMLQRRHVADVFSHIGRLFPPVYDISIQRCVLAVERLQPLLAGQFFGLMPHKLGNITIDLDSLRASKHPAASVALASLGFIDWPTASERARLAYLFRRLVLRRLAVLS